MADIKVTGEKVVNRLILGLLFLIIFGLIGGLTAFLLGVPLRGDVSDLGFGIANIGTAEGAGVLVWWVASTLIIAGIALFLVGRMTFFVPFKKAEDRQPDIPRKTTIITALILGAIISFLFFVTNSILNIFGTDLSATDIQKIFDALLAGDFTTLFIGLLFAIIVGTIVVFVASRTSNVENIAEDAGINKF